MDGENNGSKPYVQMDDLGGFPIIFGNIHIDVRGGRSYHISPRNWVFRLSKLNFTPGLVFFLVSPFAVRSALFRGGKASPTKKKT